MRILKSFRDWLDFNRSRSVSSSDESKLIDPQMLGIAQSEQFVDDDGVVQTRLVFSTNYRPSSELKVSDFALQNLLAAGVQLKEVGSLNSTILSDADNAINGVESLKSENHESN